MKILSKMWFKGPSLLWLFMLAPGLVAASDWQTKVDPLVLQNAANGETEFFLVFNEQADVSGAAALKTKQEKGAYVFSCLTNRAAQVQKATVDLLKASGIPHQSFWIADMILVKGDLATVRRLSAQAVVSRVIANPSVPYSLPVTPPLALATPLLKSSVEWNIAKVGAPEVWALGYTGQGVVVGGQDTGYEWTHPALLHQYRGWSGTATNHNYNWHDAIHAKSVNNTSQNPFGYNTIAPVDDDAHGTHTMGTMVGSDGGGNQIGMAPGARWIGCRNMERGWGNPASYAECFQWFLAPTDLNNANPDPSQAPDVINNSWYCPAEEGCFDPMIYQVLVHNLRAAGIVVVVSAGNSGPDCGSIRFAPEVYPESFDVGATDINDLIAGFSSRGPAIIGTNILLKPNVCAPGVNIRSSVPGASYAGGWSGTSMAGPHVAGVVALLLSAHPELKGQVEAVERIIEQTAVPRTNAESCGGFLGTQIPNTAYGWGRVDALAALALGDSDSDGIPDWWEMWRKLDRFDSADAALDSDGDGVSNLSEYVADTDPNEPQSYFYIGSASAPPQPTLAFQSSSNCLYTLLRTTNLTPAHWVPVSGASAIPGSGSYICLIDINETMWAPCFYRVSVQR